MITWTKKIAEKLVTPMSCIRVQCPMIDGGFPDNQWEGSDGQQRPQGNAGDIKLSSYTCSISWYCKCLGQENWRSSTKKSDRRQTSWWNTGMLFGWTLLLYKINFRG